MANKVTKSFAERRRARLESLLEPETSIFDTHMMYMMTSLMKWVQGCVLRGEKQLMAGVDDSAAGPNFAFDRQRTPCSTYYATLIKLQTSHTSPHNALYSRDPEAETMTAIIVRALPVDAGRPDIPAYFVTHPRTQQQQTTSPLPQGPSLYHGMCLSSYLSLLATCQKMMTGGDSIHLTCRGAKKERSRLISTHPLLYPFLPSCGLALGSGLLATQLYHNP
ncbi:unnamed protein product [Periconia digitata]|uniref:Uncharacterized protein n=1 Tax=Periconia digitata TaxID=1303443 RepID=A0A9W4U9F9_9PLEO|nr:unnamed protein product [Periconia digitata]